MHSLQLVYVPAFCLFHRYKTMNVTASNGPAMKYHCTVVFSEKRKYLVTKGQIKMKDPKQNKLVLLYSKLSSPTSKNSIQKDFCDNSCYMLHPSPSLSIHFLLIILIFVQSLFTPTNMTVNFFDNKTNPMQKSYMN